MGSNGGSGYPNTLRCTKCKTGSDWKKRPTGLGTRLVRTGRVKPLAKSQEGYGNARAIHERVEYRCLDCGHVGWTRMSDIMGYPVVLASMPQDRKSDSES